MLLGGPTATADSHGGSVRQVRNGTGDAAPEKSRALVLVQPVAAAASMAGPAHRPAAAFLAQLIAAAQRVPQSRRRRRASPAEAQRAYQAASATDGPGKFSRMM